MKLEFGDNRSASRDHRAVLRAHLSAEFAGEMNFIRPPPDEIRLGRPARASHQRLVDRDIAALGVFHEEHRVGDRIEQFLRREGPAEGCGESVF